MEGVPKGSWRRSRRGSRGRDPGGGIPVICGRSGAGRGGSGTRPDAAPARVSLWRGCYSSLRWRSRRCSGRSSPSLSLGVGLVLGPLTPGLVPLLSSRRRTPTRNRCPSLLQGTLPRPGSKEPQREPLTLPSVYVSPTPQGPGSPDTPPVCPTRTCVRPPATKTLSLFLCLGD